MCGGGLSYDVYVPVSACPQWQRDCDVNRNTHTTIISDGEFYNFPDATVPQWQRNMDQGWDKYEAWNKHEKRARQIMLKIAQKAFPELNRFGDTLPLLWVTDLMPVETSAEAWVTWDCSELINAPQPELMPA